MKKVFLSILLSLFIISVFAQTNSYTRADTIHLTNTAKNTTVLIDGKLRVLRATSGNVTDSVYTKGTDGFFHLIKIATPVNGVLSGLTLSVSGSTLTVQPGTWRITNTIYSKNTTTIFTLSARDSVLSGYETVYADSANSIHIAVGMFSLNPVEPAIPSGDVRVGAALITPSGTTTGGSSSGTVAATNGLHMRLDSVALGGTLSQPTTIQFSNLTPLSFRDSTGNFQNNFNTTGFTSSYTASGTTYKLVNSQFGSSLGYSIGANITGISATQSGGLVVTDGNLHKGLMADATIDTANMTLYPKSYVTSEWVSHHGGISSDSTLYKTDGHIFVNRNVIVDTTGSLDIITQTSHGTFNEVFWNDNGVAMNSGGGSIQSSFRTQPVDTTGASAEWGIGSIGMHIGSDSVGIRAWNGGGYGIKYSGPSSYRNIGTDTLSIPPIGWVIRYVAAHSGTSYTAGYGLNLTGTVFKADSILLASKLWALAAFNTKAQDASVYQPIGTYLTPTNTQPVSNKTFLPANTVETPAGTAGTDSVMVKHSGQMRAISATYYGTGGSGVTGTGTVNTIPKVTNATGPVIGDSHIIDNGTNIIHGSVTSVSGGDIWFYGTSITQGQGASPGTSYRYSTLLAGALGLTEHNFGVSGQVASALNLTTIPTKGSTDRYIVFEFGTNEVLTSVSTSAFTTALNADIANALGKGWTAANVVVIGCFYSTFTSGNNTALLAMNAAAKAVAVAGGYMFVDEYLPMSTSMAPLLIPTAGNIHPTNEGHRIASKLALAAITANYNVTTQNTIMPGLVELSSLKARNLPSVSDTTATYLIAADSLGNIGFVDQTRNKFTLNRTILNGNLIQSGAAYPGTYDTKIDNLFNLNAKFFSTFTSTRYNYIQIGDASLNMNLYSSYLGGTINLITSGGTDGGSVTAATAQASGQFLIPNQLNIANLKLIDCTTAGFHANITLFNTNGNTVYSNNYTNGDQIFNTVTGEAMRVTHGNRLLIGTATDDTKNLLQVAGSARAKSFVTYASPSAVNSTATLTAAQEASGYITTTSAAAVTMTTTTAAALATQIGAVQGTGYPITIDNTAGANTTTLALGTGFTQLPGVSTSLTVPSGTTGVGTWLITFVSATAATISRIQ
jgi:hypothetical protein